MSSLSVIVITKNEAENIAECLASAVWADELIVVDAQSKDDTVQIAGRFTDQIYVVPWQGFAANKTIGLNHAHSEWILWLDADERIPSELAEEMRALLLSQPEENGFQISRKAFFLGRWIRHCGWYPGYVLRLFRRDQGRFSDRLVHEGVIVEGRCGRLRHSLEHYTDRDLEHYLAKFNHYTTLASRELVQKGRRSGIAAILLHPLHQFVKMYLLKRGFLDGVEGLMLCLLSANYVAAKYAKAWELSHCKNDKK